MIDSNDHFLQREAATSLGYVNLTDMPIYSMASRTFIAKLFLPEIELQFNCCNKAINEGNPLACSFNIRSFFFSNI